MIDAVPQDGLEITVLPPPPTFVMIGDLLDEPDDDIEAVVEGMLVTAGTSMLVAKPKVGKTTLVENLALAVARGIPFLGRTTQPGLVLYLALEEKRGEVRRSLRALGARGDDRLGLWIATAPHEPVEWLTREIERRRPALVIIDTVQRFLRLSDLNDYAVVSNALEPVTALARETGAHILMTHHGNKVGGNDGDAVLGSTALFGSVDTLIEIRRKGSCRTIWTDQRYGENLDETILQFDPSTRWLSLAGTRQEVEAKAAADEILSYLGSVPEPVDEKTIQAGIGGNRAAHVAALRSLVEDGRVKREGAGKKGSPFLYSRTDLYRAVPEYENWKHGTCPECWGALRVSPDGQTFCATCPSDASHG